MAGGALTLGGAGHARMLKARPEANRIGGVSPAAMKPRLPSEIVEIALGAASLTGAAARSDRPEAMLARGSRVTGSGGAAMSMPAAAQAVSTKSRQALALPCGGSVSFAVLADFRPEHFL